MSERDYGYAQEEDPYYQPQTVVNAPNPQRPDNDPYFTQPLQDGVLGADTGYGWGGVDNPAYVEPHTPSNTATNILDPNLYNKTTTTTNTGGPRPPTGGAVNSISAPSSGINVPSASLPQGILDLFNKPQTVTPIQSAYQDALLGFMKRGQTTPTLDDSILGPQTEVFRAAQQRNTERQRRSVAERAAANGQSESGYLDQQINKGVQEQGFNTASFNANLLGGEMNKRREELQAGLQLASATGNAEAARELQAKLAQISAMMQQQGLNLQGQLGAGDLALRWGLGTENLNQQALQIIMNGMQP